MKSPAILPLNYAQWLADLKRRIQGARQRALLAANSEQIRLYHEIGQEILERQSRDGWGAKVIDRRSNPHGISRLAAPAPGKLTTGSRSAASESGR